MRWNRTRPLGTAVLLLGLLALPAWPNPNEAPVEESDRPLSTAGQLTIRDHLVEVVLNNGFATTTVKQVLENTGGQAKEAVWSMPLPREAALCELSFEIAGKRVIGEVVEVQRAREIYEEEKADGRDAGLAEKKDYRYYQVSLTRVPAGGRVEAHVVYIQALDIESGVGRYLYPLTPGGTDDGMDRAFWTMEKKTTGRLRFDVKLKTAFGIDGLHCPSHPAFKAVASDEGDAWSGSIELPQAKLDRDFVLFYRLRSDLPARVELMTHRAKDAGEGTFMAVVTPGGDLERIQKGRDWVFVLDISGSMKGEKIRMMSRSVADAIDGLQTGDRFQVLLFNNRNHRVTRTWIAAGSEQARKVRDQAASLVANGGTALYPALEDAYRIADADRPTAVVMISDGAANIGPTQTRAFRKLAESHDIRLFTFAIGNSANWPLLRDLAETTGGFPKAISVHEEIAAHLMLARDRMSHVAMHDVDVKLPRATAIYPRHPHNLYVGQQLVLLGRYATPGPTTLEVSAKIGGEAKTWKVELDLPETESDNPEIERLYALAAIRDIERGIDVEGASEDDGRQSVIDLALKYSLVTDHTAMVVVDPSRKAKYGLGKANATRRAREKAAVAQREQTAQKVTRATGRKPLAGKRAAHAPTRARRRQSAPQDSGGSSGGGAIGPFWILILAAFFGLRRRHGSA
ncbi:MAG: VIT domain-containing protein [Planctomycetota bacterium]